MVNYFCTLFDSNYLSRGVACYESLKSVNSNFKLYIFAFDDKSERVLKDLNMDHVQIIPLKEFEDEELLAVKKSRTHVEYCWTCTPSTIRFVLSKFKHDHCTYIDADLFFKQDPEVLFAEMGKNSILITPHNYTEKYNQSSTSGIYCVQYMTFKNDEIGLNALNWWRDSCLEWCFNRHENGKFGDQKYLDDWPQRFEKVYVTQNHGEGVAPWNIQQWPHELSGKIIFYHFHALRLFKDFAYLGAYKIPEWAKNELYKDYIQTLKKIDCELLSRNKSYESSFKDISWRDRLKIYKDKLRLKNNFYHYES